MITKDYNKGPRVVKNDYVLWKIQNMQESASLPPSSDQSQFPIRSLDLKEWLKTPWVEATNIQILLCVFNNWTDIRKV